MLNLDICKKCINETSLWTYRSGEEWENKKVWCPASVHDIPYDKINWNRCRGLIGYPGNVVPVSTEGNPPKRCPYKLEHGVAECLSHA